MGFVSVESPIHCEFPRYVTVILLCTRLPIKDDIIGTCRRRYGKVNGKGRCVGTCAGQTDSTGRGVRYTTGTTIGSWVGARGSTQYATRQFNPVFRCKFRLNQTNSGNVFRFFAGFATNTAVLADSNDPLNALNGIGVFIASTDTTFTIAHNDSVGATSTTAITGTPAIDTNAHTVEITADDGGTRFAFSWDGGANQYITSNIPAQTGPLNYHVYMYNVTTTSTNFDLFWAELESDK